MARRRGLDEVFHFFISEEEQREIRARSEQSGSAAPAVRWCIAANPERPLSGALVRDLAVALAQFDRRVHVVAPFSAPFEPAAAVVWHSGTDPRELDRALSEVPPGCSLVAIERAARIAAWLEQPRHDGTADFDALLLPIEAAEWGIAEARATLRELAEAARSLRIVGVVLSAADPKSGRALFARLAAWARSEFRLELEFAGSLDRDRASFRSLLQGIPLTQLDPTAASARSLERLIACLIPETSAPRGRQPGTTELG
ncbi:MAG: hypothetical protein VX614_00330 [Myxococcota bacterium]|nr:hypothetical protein [Myxococcota bacterium]